MNRWLWWVATLSIVINLLLIGFLAGRAQGPDFAAPPPQDPMFGFRQLVRELPEERRQQIVPLLHDSLRELGSTFRGLRTAQQQIRNALLADPYDQQAFDAALQSFRTRLMDTQQRSHSALSNLAGQLTQEERAMLANRLQRPPGGRRGGPAEHGKRPFGGPGHRPPPPGTGPGPGPGGPW